MVVKKVLRKRKNNQIQRLKRILKTKKKIKIYLAGPIAGLEEQQDYRQSIAESLKRVSEKFEILDPWEREKLEMPDLTYSDIEDPEERKQFAEEIVIRDLKDIQSADILIAYVFRISSGTCLSMDTEILTKQGWKNYDSLQRGEEILGLNLRNNKLEYTPVLKKIETLAPSITWKNRILDMRVTPNHGILVQKYKWTKRKYSELQTVPAIDLFTFSNKIWKKIPVTGKLGEREGCKFTKSQLKLLGWLLTEGSLDRNSNRITITQSLKHEEYCEEIETLLKTLGIPFSKRQENRKGFSPIMRWRFNAKYLPCSFKENWKRIPRKILNEGNYEELSILFNTIMKGDGCKSRKTISEKNWALISDYQELLLLLGKRSTISKVRNSYQLYFSNKRTALVKEGIFDPTLERMWSIETPLETLVVRRNGKIFITHNSMEIFWMNRVLRKPVITIYTAKEKLPLWIYIHSSLVFTSRRKFIIWLRKVLEGKL